ncbi:uncharacterized protein ACRADG_010479 [Cochliomyia hominivorax]
MRFIVKFVNLILCVILLNDLLETKAQLNSGISVVLGKKQYYIETTDTGNFYQAAYACAKLGMKLASFEDKSTEQKKLYNVLNLSDISDQQYWLSGISVGSSSKKFIWLGTGKVSTTSLEGTDTGCLATDASFNLKVAVCGSDTHYYICEKPLEPYCGILGQCRYTYSTSTN